MNEALARMGIEIDLESVLRLYLLVVARMVGAAQPLPFFGGQLVPMRIRFGIPLFLALFLYPFVTQGIEYAEVPPVGWLYFALLIKELFVGFCIGFIASLPFHAVTISGAFIDTQRGTTFASVIAPMTGGQTSLLGSMLNLFFIVIFLSVGGAHLVVQGVGLSYASVPLLDFPTLLSPERSGFVEYAIRMTNDMYRIGVQIAGPVVLALFLTDMTLGIVNRAAPNIQVFFLGMGIKAAGGLIVLFLMVGAMSEQLARMAVSAADGIAETVRRFVGG